MDIQIGYNGDARRDDLLRILRAHLAVVVFTKVSGEERIMRCTLLPEMLPERQNTASEGYHTEETGSLSVWDVDKKDWRAFRMDSVKEILYRTKV